MSHRQKKKICWFWINVSSRSTQRSLRDAAMQQQQTHAACVFFFAHLWLCVHYASMFRGTADSCCRVHHSAAVFIGWWPRTANSCIVQEQTQRAAGNQTRVSDSAGAQSHCRNPFLKSCANCLHTVSNGVLLAHQRQGQQGRVMGYVHCGTEDDKELQSACLHSRLSKLV